MAENKKTESTPVTEEKVVESTEVVVEERLL